MNQDPRLRLEEAINVLERPIRSLRVQEVRDRDEREANDSPDDPKLVPEVLDTGQCGLYDGVVADPVRRHGERSTLGAHFEGVDFCARQLCVQQPTCSTYR